MALLSKSGISLVWACSYLSYPRESADLSFQMFIIKVTQWADKGEASVMQLSFCWLPVRFFPCYTNHLWGLASGIAVILFLLRSM